MKRVFNLATKTILEAASVFFIMTSILNYLNFFCIRFNNCQSEACDDSERASLGSIPSANRFINFTLLKCCGSASQQEIGILRRVDDRRRRP